ncbi:hypothetical protein CAC42_4491 [Sphaceloma murrayae]|uniref:Uncharacterized protein n=1 Tax=Sphaceloma murrayae TaxID=2082308 RepID=A0A2K1QMJ2_9PEZI|nr:hypothetical protein CAC42_4491 [Sphaceloma murrayae]
MYTVTDIPALREQILANATFLFRNEKAPGWGGIAPKFDVVVSTIPDNSTYAASIVDVNNGELYITGNIDANPAMAVFKLLDVTAEKLTGFLRGLPARQFTPASTAVAGDGKA